MLISILNRQTLTCKHILLDHDFEYMLISIYMLNGLALVSRAAMAYAPNEKPLKFSATRSSLAGVSVAGRRYIAAILCMS
jgi:hypothetical protein